MRECDGWLRRDHRRFADDELARDHRHHDRSNSERSAAGYSDDCHDDPDRSDAALCNAACRGHEFDPDAVGDW